MLSNTCKYAMRAVVYLAINAGTDQLINIKTISEDLKLPTPFLGKILQTLAKAGLLLSAKGPTGGFMLAKPATEISFYDVVKVIDGTSMFDECLFGMEICKSCCDNKMLCPMYSTSDTLRHSLKDLFADNSIANLAKGLLGTGAENAI